MKAMVLAAVGAAAPQIARAIGATVAHELGFNTLSAQLFGGLPPLAQSCMHGLTGVGWQPISSSSAQIYPAVSAAFGNAFSSLTQRQSASGSSASNEGSLSTTLIELAKKAAVSAVKAKI